ncbi:MAG: STAS domain-containing protein [Gammaproteobacteria bacterium]|nr:STAS domain-containing protein [Gammaproteobacteria bacterium]
MAVATLDRDLGIDASGALKTALAAHLHAPSVELDAGGVERVHTAGLQVLLAWWQARESAGRQTRWSGCSETLRSAAATLGLATALGLDGLDDTHTHNGEQPS